MNIKDMDQRQFADWAAGHILTSLIKGDLLAGVFWVLQNHAGWLDHQKTKK